jgi:predicted naringenin-chalcone synthase
MSFAIVGLGTALPDNSVPQADALRVARALCCRTEEETLWLSTVYSQIGVETRHLVLGPDVVHDFLHGTKHSGSAFLPTGDEEYPGPTTGVRLRHYAELAPPLALRAARAALNQSKVPARTLTHLVTVSCTGFVAPGVDLALIEGLGLAPTVQRTHVGFMGCHGAINGLRVARAFTGADASARVLLCAVELCSLHYTYGFLPHQMIANALFADGAAALVGLHPAAAAGPAWRVAACGSCLIPGSADAMSWTVGDHGFEMTLSKSVPALIARHLRPWLEAWLGGQGLALADVQSWAVHPGGPRILTAAEEALALPASATAASRAVFAECGNMSSPTILFILDRMRRCGAARPCVALGFGPGLMAEAALFV